MAEEDLSKLKIDKSRTAAGKASQRRSWKLAALFVFVTLLVGAYASGLLKPAIQVEVATVSQVYPSQAVTLLNASGYVVPQRKAAIASKVTGKLVSLLVEEGSKVKKGEVIARLESDDVTAAQRQARANLEMARWSLDQAKAELVDAKASFEREKRLFEREYTARAGFDAAEARYKKAMAAVAGGEAAVRAASAALEGANVALEYTLIRVPFDAVVLTKNADIGDIVTPLGAAANAKAAVVTIADMTSLQVEADLSESNLERVRIGQPCEIQLDALPDMRFKGAVHMIVPTADRSKATVMVKVRFIDGDNRILPEMSAKVAFLSRPLDSSEQKPRKCVIANAILTRGTRKVVFLIKGDRVAETPVTTGTVLGDVVEILSGVNPGDKVVLRPLDRLHDGSKIKVAEQ